MSPARDKSSLIAPCSDACLFHTPATSGQPGRCGALLGMGLATRVDCSQPVGGLQRHVLSCPGRPAPSLGGPCTGRDRWPHRVSPAGAGPSPGWGQSPGWVVASQGGLRGHVLSGLGWPTPSPGGPCTGRDRWPRLAGLVAIITKVEKCFVKRLTPKACDYFMSNGSH